MKKMLWPLDIPRKRGKVKTCSLKTDTTSGSIQSPKGRWTGYFGLCANRPVPDADGFSPARRSGGFFSDPRRVGRTERFRKEVTAGSLSASAGKGRGRTCRKRRQPGRPAGRAAKKSPTPLAKTESRDNLRMSPEGMSESPRGERKKVHEKSPRRLAKAKTGDKVVRSPETATGSLEAKQRNMMRLTNN